MSVRGGFRFKQLLINTSPPPLLLNLPNLRCQYPSAYFLNHSSSPHHEFFIPLMEGHLSRVSEVFQA
jgi:hypothetical protein